MSDRRKNFVKEEVLTVSLHFCLTFQSILASNMNSMSSKLSIADLSVKKSLLTVREVASYLRVHSATVYRLLRRGELPAFKVGSDWRFNRESLDRWRLAQAQRIASQQGAFRSVAGEVFHVVYWYQAEGLNDAVAAADVGLFVERTATAIMRELNRLVQAGLLAKKKAGRDIRYSLTHQGLAYARQLFGELQAATAGHASMVEFELQRHERDAARFGKESSGPNGRTEVRS